MLALLINVLEYVPLFYFSVIGFINKYLLPIFLHVRRYMFVTILMSDETQKSIFWVVLSILT